MPRGHKGVPALLIPRTVTQEWLARQLGVHRNTISSAVRAGSLNLRDLWSFVGWTYEYLLRRGAAPRPGTADDTMAAAARHLASLGVVALRVSVGTYLWCPDGAGRYGYFGELSGAGLQLARGLVQPPFAVRLRALDELVSLGKGGADEVLALRLELQEQVGVSDPVVLRILARRGRVRVRAVAGCITVEEAVPRPTATPI